MPTAACTEPDPTLPEKPRRSTFARRAALGFYAVLAGLSLGMLILCALAFKFRPDALAAVTVWPVWAWAAAGAWLGLAARRAPKLMGLAAIAGWLAFALTFAEEPRSLWRQAFGSKPSADETAVTLRVVSYNCAVGNAAAAAEALALRPDVALLQESPSAQMLTTCADAAYGKGSTVLWSSDCSIVVRPGIQVQSSGYPGRPFMLARLKLRDGRLMEVWSLRLMSACIRIDLWNRDCWAAHRRNRTSRRNQMQYVTQALSLVPARRPIIIGGDFNAPAGDAAPRLLEPRLRDAFTSAGRGWGNTMMSDIPVTRIDQIWTSEHIEPLAVWAESTRFSDHRAVVCELRLKPLE